MLCLGALSLGTPCCESSGVRGLTNKTKSVCSDVRLPSCTSRRCPSLVVSVSADAARDLVGTCSPCPASWPSACPAHKQSASQSSTSRLSVKDRNHVYYWDCALVMHWYRPMPIIGIGPLVRWYRPTVVFALCGLHVTEIKFMYASMYVICWNMRVASISSKSGCVLNNFAFGCIFVLSALCSPSSK